MKRVNPLHDPLERGLQAVSPTVADAARASDAVLQQKRVRHLVCGGLAVASYGYPRATRDVDYLVGDEAFVAHGRLVMLKDGIPYRASNGVSVDYVTLPEMQALVEHELDTNPTRVVSLPFLCLMKLWTYRPRDREDVTELFRIDARRADLVRATFPDVFTAGADMTEKLDACDRESKR